MTQDGYLLVKTAGHIASKKFLSQTAMAVRDPHRVARDHGRLGFTSQQRELLAGAHFSSEQYQDRTNIQEPRSGNLQRFLENAVRPYLVKIDTDRQTRLIDAVDQALSQQVRSVLHHPGFQRLEAAWRSVYWLVNRAETGTHLKIRIVHMTKDEIRARLGR